MTKGFRSGHILRPGKNPFRGPRTGIFLLLVLILFFFLTTCVPRAATPTPTPGVTPTPPGQPASGPGGADYNHAAVTKNVYGEGDTQYWIFEPASPTPSSAPLIVFNHGWIAVSPGNYGAWIEHIVRRGNIVVYPVYQLLRIGPSGTQPEQMTQNAIIAVKDAIQRLQSGGHVSPELDKFAIVGHSLGGAITANMAATAASVGLPEPKAIMLAEPGAGENIGANILTTKLNEIPATVLMLVVVGSEDTIAGTADGTKIFYQTSGIPSSKKEFITMFSDYHGDPPLIADHFAPVAPDESYGKQDEELMKLLQQRIHQILGVEVNALDYYGFWKLFDGLTDYAFYGENREYAFGDTAQECFMGKWSDSTLVVELKVSKSP